MGWTVGGSNSDGGEILPRPEALTVFSTVSNVGWFFLVKWSRFGVGNPPRLKAECKESVELYLQFHIFFLPMLQLYFALTFHSPIVAY